MKNGKLPNAGLAVLIAGLLPALALAAETDFSQMRPGHAPWCGNTLGTEDTVPSPWTKPVSADDSFACWGRTYALGGAGLLRSITSRGAELLAGPVTLSIDGRNIAFRSVRTAAGESFAEYLLEAVDSPVPLKAKLRADFDGFLWFDVTWGGAGAKAIESMAITIPMDRRNVMGLDRCYHNVFDSLMLPPGTNGVWKANPAKEPYFWLGNLERGLFGGADSLRGWYLKKKANGYVLTAEEKTVTYVMNIVDTRIVPSEPRTFGFYLEATPTKPKDLAVASLPAGKLHRWCQIDRIFDFKWEGYYREKKIAKLRDLVDRGDHVFFYGSSVSTSPNSPLWENCGDEWTRYQTRTNGHSRSMAKTPEGKLSGQWLFCCINSRDFLEFKLWTANNFINNPDFGVMDLYYDNATPLECHNPRHRCVWRDEFGDRMNDYQEKSLREFHLRLFRILRKKNPRAIFYGHAGIARSPSDAYFDRMAMGENYAPRIKSSENYYDRLTPRDLQIKYATRSNEITIDMIPQILRALQLWRPERLKTYDPHDPESDRAIRHCLAYYKIHDLNIWAYAGGRKDGDQWMKIDDELAAFGTEREYRAYFHPDSPVKVDQPEERFLHAWFRGKDKALLILLNDTDREVEKTVSIAGFEGTGRDLFNAAEFGFAAEGCKITLPPRESRFLMFKLH